jgi:hypothetical protein
MFRALFNFGFLGDSGRFNTSRRRPARKAWSHRPELLDLESRTLLSTIAWLRPVGGDWDDPANRAGGRIPTANDDAVIPFAHIQVTHATAADDAVRSLNSEAAFDLSAGSLTLGSSAADTNSRIDALFSVSGGSLGLRRSTLDGSGSLVNSGTVNFAGPTANTINIALDNEAEVSLDHGASGTINNFQREFVNGPNATLRVAQAAGLQVVAGFTNQGNIELGGVLSVGLNVDASVLVNAPGATIDLLATGALRVGRTVGDGFDNEGTVSAATSGGITGDLVVNRGTINVTASDLSVSTRAFTNHGTITIAANAALFVDGGTFSNSDGSLGGPGTLALFGAFAFFPGDVSNAVTGLSFVHTAVTVTGTLTNVRGLEIGGSTLHARAVVNQGTLLVSAVNTTIGAPFTNAAGATVSIGDEFTATGSLTVGGFTNAGTITQTQSLIGKVGNASLTITSGTLVNAPGARLDVPVVNGALDNQGTLTITQETTVTGTLTGGLANSGTIDVRGGNLTVNSPGFARAFVNTGSVIIASLRGVFVEGGNFTNSGTVAVGGFGTLLATGNYIQTAGLTSLNDGVLTAGGLVDLEGGVLAGTGVINANVLNNAEVDVGRHNFPSVLTIVGDYTQTAAGVLVIEIEISGPGVRTDADQLNITGQATLDGTLTVRLLTAILPPSGESFVILTFGSGSGVFATINGDGGPLFTPSYDPTDVTLMAN